MPEPITYELVTIQDIFDKVPTDRIRSCMDELGILLCQAAGTRDLFIAVAEEIGVDPAGVSPKLPEFFTWIDDGKGELTFHVAAKDTPDSDEHTIFSIDTRVPQKPLNPA